MKTVLIIALAVLGFLFVMQGVSAAPFAYITNINDDTVSVIDTETNAVTATIATGDGPYGVAVNPAGTRVYVTNEYANTVSVINAATNAVTATVQVGHIPFGIAVNPAGTRVYVANSYSDTVSVIDAATNGVTAAVEVGETPVGVAVDPAGTRLYVTNFYDGTVSVVDTATRTVNATLAVGTYPYGAAVNPAGTQVYVANQGSGTVSVIDTATSTVAGTVKVGSSPVGIAMNPAGTRAYVANMGSNSVSVIDTGTGTVINTVNIGSGPFGVTVNPAGTYAFVAVYGSNRVSVIDTATNTVSATIAVGSGPVAFGQFIRPGTPLRLPIAAFATNETTGTAPLAVKFTDQSTGLSLNRWNWSFGDGTWFNTTIAGQKNPSHVYPAAGTFTTKLIVCNTSGCNTTGPTKTITVTASRLPVVKFATNVSSGYAPLAVKFTDQSTGLSLNRWNWSFGDGTWFNTTIAGRKSPSHVYPAAGTYPATLTVCNTSGCNTTVPAVTIIVSPGVVALPGSDKVPTDPDGDGRYEDLNGGGALGFADVVLFFQYIEWIHDNEPAAAFDFNGNGVVGFADIVTLFNELP